MTKTIQNIVLLQETPRDAFDISMKAGKMFFNRFCIDEEAGFELSGVYNIKDSPTMKTYKSHTPKHRWKEIGKGSRLLIDRVSEI